MELSMIDEGVAVQCKAAILILYLEDLAIFLMRAETYFKHIWLALFFSDATRLTEN